MMFFTSAENLAGLNTLGKDDQVLFSIFRILHSNNHIHSGHAEERTSKDEEEGRGFQR